MATYLTPKQLEHRLGVTPMTLHYWRKPDLYKQPSRKPQPADKNPPMPTVVIEKSNHRRQVLFDLDAIRSWIEKYRPAYLKKLSSVCNCKLCRKPVQGPQEMVQPAPLKPRPLKLHDLVQ